LYYKNIFIFFLCALQAEILRRKVWSENFYFILRNVIIL